MTAKQKQPVVAAVRDRHGAVVFEKATRRVDEWLGQPLVSAPRFEHGRFADLIFEAISFENSDFSDAQFDDCVFTNVAFGFNVIVGSRFANSVFDNVVFCGPVFGGNRFKGCVFRGVSFMDLTINECSFAGTRFEHVAFKTWSPIGKLRIADTDFATGTFADVEFHNAKHRNTTFPPGFDPAAHDGLVEVP